MQAYIKTVALISRVCGIFAAGLIAAAVLIVCEMVYLRYILNENTIWQTDFVTYSLVGATFIGSPYVLLTRGHVNVDVLPHYLPAGPRYWLAPASVVLSLPCCPVCAGRSFLFLSAGWVEKWGAHPIWGGGAGGALRRNPVGGALLCVA